MSRGAGWAEVVTGSLARAGINVAGVADGSAYSGVLPGCRSVLVFASGGPALWDAFVADLRAEPAHLSGEDHPLDAYVRRAIDAADPSPPAGRRRWIRCAADEPDPVDFRTLARQAGLGWRSALGLLLHPVHGPWLGLRAACFTVDSLPVASPLAGPGPCGDCPAPCASACPAAAIVPPGGPGRPASFRIAACARWNIEREECGARCAARAACPVGADHRYSPLEFHYHQDRRSGRSALAAHLGITDRRSGVGPAWAAWAATPRPREGTRD